MKRSRFDSDYERVRRKPPPEFPDAGDDDLFARERAERIAASHADFRDRMAKLAEIEKKQEEERKIRADANTRRSNRLALIHEYERAGVAPPLVNEDGTPSCSLSLLLQLGWSIERFGDSLTLVKPRMIDDRSQRRSNNRQKPAAEAGSPGETSE